MAEYIVKSGDNLSTIAKNNNTTVQNLASLNKIQDVNKINVGQRLVLGTPNVQTSITSTNTAPATPTTVVQPQVSTGATTLQSDIISKGQADTARAVAEEAKIAAQQGTKAPTATQDVLKNILGVSTQTTPTTPTTAPTVDNTMATTNVNGITADTLAQQRQGIQDTLNNVLGETRLTQQEYAGTVDPAKAELDEANRQVNEEALAGRRRIEAVLQIPGITKEQAQDKINEISRVNASKLADLSIVQMGKQGKYDSAKEIADRAVQAKVEDQKNKLDALMFTYTENKELFTKAEQRAFEVAQADRERKLNAEEKNLQRISDLSLLALQSNAPASVVTRMRNAKTEAEAIAIGGQYISNMGALDIAVKKANIAQSNAAAAASNRSNQLMSGAGGNYNTNQIKYITSLNEAVSKNDTYKKTTNAKTYTDNVLTALSQGTGTGDLAAINQFQKVIDEGAVTRDQDVKLIQQSQSLVNSITSKFKKLGSGQQLSPTLRAEMQNAVTQLYQGQVQALQKDPYIASKLAETKLYGINSADTILGEISSIQQTQQPQIAPEKEQAFNNIVGIKTPTTLQPNTVSNALFGNQATTNTIIPFNLNNFKTTK